MADENGGLPHRGRFGDWDQVAEVTTAWEAELIRGRLIDAGLEAEIVDQSFELLPIANNTDFERMLVVVPAARVDEALRILRESAPLAEDSEVPGLAPEVPAPAEDEPVKE